MIRICFLLAIFSFQLVLWAPFVQAGFGVSPPYISSEKIRPGIRYEQSINLLRSEAEEALELEFILDSPEIADWVSFEGGDSVLMPVGMKKIARKVYIDVPKDADLGNYQGKLIVKTKALSDTGAMISLSTGAEISIDFDLSDKLYHGLDLKNTVIADYKAPGDFLSSLSITDWFRKIKLYLTIENTGNADYAPTKISLDIYDIDESNLLFTLLEEDLDQIKAFRTEEIDISFPVKLNEGQYWGKIKVYDDNKIIYSNKIAFTALATKTSGKMQTMIYLTLFLIVLSLAIIIRKVTPKKRLA